MSQIIEWRCKSEPEQRGLRTPLLQRLNAHRLQGAQRTFHETVGRGPAGAAGRLRRPLTRRFFGRQPDLTLGFQLQEQAPAAIVPRLAGAVAPVPGEAQVAREPRAIRVGMSFQPRSNPRDFFGADQPPLNDRRAVHWLSSGRENWSEQNKKKFFGSCCWSAQISPPAGVGNVKMRIAERPLLPRPGRRNRTLRRPRACCMTPPFSGWRSSSFLELGIARVVHQIGDEFGEQRQFNERHRRKVLLRNIIARVNPALLSEDLCGWR